MRERTKCENLNQVRLMDVKQLCAYTGLGKNSAKALAVSIGADRHFGKSVRYDKLVLDQYLNQLRHS